MSDGLIEWEQAGLLIDGHLDLAWNARLGRDLTLPLSEIRARDEQSSNEQNSAGGDVATLSFGALRSGRVALCLGTLFAMPQQAAYPWGYTDPQSARAQALAQLDCYLRWQDAGHVSLLHSGSEVAAHLTRYAQDQAHTPLGVVLLMEGADPVLDAEDLPFWVSQGVRIVGPAWKRTRYSGGTGAPGSLTPAGTELLHAMRDHGVTLDASHLADDAFWQACELQPKVIASHSNARAVVNKDRHLSDEMLRQIAHSGGMVGVVLYNGFLQPGWVRGQPPTPLPLVGEMLRHMASAVGWERLGLGSDLDGGFGAHEFPEGIDSAADLHLLGEVVPAQVRAGVLGGHWARWLTQEWGRER